MGFNLAAQARQVRFRAYLDSIQQAAQCGLVFFTAAVWMWMLVALKVSHPCSRIALGE